MKVRGVGGIVPAAGIATIYPDPVVAQIQAMQASAYAAANPPAPGIPAGLGGFMRTAGMGCCGNGVQQEIPWVDAYGESQLMGRDVNMQAVPLAGMGDWVPGTPFMRSLKNPFTENALVSSLAGLNAIDYSSLSNFWSSIQTDQSIIPGVNDVVVLGAAAVLLLVLGSSGGGHRR